MLYSDFFTSTYGRFISTYGRLFRLFGLMAILFCVSLSHAASNNKAVRQKQPASVDNVRMWSDSGNTRIVLDLNAPVKYSLSYARNPDRIYIDISNAVMNASLTKLPLARTPLSIIRSSVIERTDVRLTLELTRKITPKVFFLEKHGKNADRLVIDLHETGSVEIANTAPATSPSTPAAVPVAAPPEPSEVKPTISLASGKRDILITVDAGHGGQDTGALGSNGLREKDITLAIAKELIAIINAQPGFSAHATRTTDVYIPLKTRRNIARDKKSDLFVSIHADAFTNSRAKGASVFALSRKGATSETARFLAQHENESDKLAGVGGVSLDDKDAVLAGVLVDLSITATVNSSLLVGNQVLKSLGLMATLHGRHVEQAGFLVLKSPDVPSILVETGFISNKEEARKLASNAYRTQIAQHIFKGLYKYFSEHPPSGSAVAAPSNSKSIAEDGKHLVVRGDTLSSIAARYKVSQRSLTKYNNLKSSNVMLGQTLKIPAK